MKTSIKGMRMLGPLLFILVIFISCGAPKTITNTATAQELAKSIDSSNWTFSIQQVRPQQGPGRIPNGNYTVIYKPGLLNVYLPYFGRAFSGADIFQAENPLSFISKDFVVEKEQLKENKWSIVFKPTDQRQVQSMTFTLFSNGSGSLNVIMTNRTPIAYSGSLSANK